LDAEAERFARDLWDKLLTKCGDSYYFYSAVVLHGDSRQFTLSQYKNVSFATRPQTVSEADRMNGIQWQGLAIMIAGLHRNQRVGLRPIPQSLQDNQAAWKTFDREPWGRWDDWLGNGKGDASALPVNDRGDTELGSGSSNRVWMTKRDGKWSLHVSFNVDNQDLSDIDQIAQRRPTCAEIPEAVSGK
jgi:hypothetical protein